MRVHPLPTIIFDPNTMSADPAPPSYNDLLNDGLVVPIRSNPDSGVGVVIYMQDDQEEALKKCVQDAVQDNGEVITPPSAPEYSIKEEQKQQPSLPTQPSAPDLPKEQEPNRRALYNDHVVQVAPQETLQPLHRQYSCTACYLGTKSCIKDACSDCVNCLGLCLKDVGRCIGFVLKCISAPIVWLIAALGSSLTAICRCIIQSLVSAATFVYRPVKCVGRNMCDCLGAVCGCLGNCCKACCTCEVLGGSLLVLLVIVLFALVVGLFIFPLYVGAHFLSEPCAHDLAMWLIVWSVHWIVLLACLACVASVGRVNDPSTCCCFSQLVCLIVLCILFAASWLIVGTIWVFSPGASECNTWVYKTAEAVVLGQWSLSGLACILLPCFISCWTKN